VQVERRQRRRAASLVLAGALIAAAGPVRSEPPSPDARRAAVETALAGAPECKGLGSYYWEIGDANGRLASGSSGGRIDARRSLPIASASKWVFGAYVAERTGGHPSPEQLEALEMRSGRDRLKAFNCALSRTVDRCLAKGENAAFDPAHEGFFSYNGGHDQWLAAQLGLGGLDAKALTEDLHRVLGDAASGIAYRHPEPAGGMEASPAAYAGFLRALIGGRLQLSALLASSPVCTLPAQCPKAVSSPSPLAWHYSLNHWIEDAPGADGALSSPGLFGFYPWIEADHKTYGLLARESHASAAYLKSASCGAVMRRAWDTGSAPPASP
jgi:hypothetical protein